jgi:hypothetical protein
VFVIAVSQEYTRNLSCKKISLLARELKEQAPKTAAELCFVMIDGNYTTESHPHKVSGWLGHMLGASLWTPGWSHAHCAVAAEAEKGSATGQRAEKGQEWTNQHQVFHQVFGWWLGFSIVQSPKKTLWNIKQN